MENPTNWPVHMQEYQMVMLISAGSDKLKEKHWSWLPTFLLRVEALKLIPHQSRMASPFPETTTWTRCICRWTAWRPKTLLFIIVLESHSDTGSHRAAHKPLHMSLWHSLIESAESTLYKSIKYAKFIHVSVTTCSKLQQKVKSTHHQADCLLLWGWAALYL